MTSINTDKTTEYGKPYNTDFHDEWEVDFHAHEENDDKLGTQEEWEKLFADRVKVYQESTNSYITYKLSFNDEVFF